MSSIFTRRCLIKTSGLAMGASLLPASVPAAPFAGNRDAPRLIHLNLNENPFGPSPTVEDAIRRDFNRLSRYADATAAQAFAEQIAAYERVAVQQVVLGEILGALGLYLGSEGGPGGQFIYSTPGYLALIDGAIYLINPHNPTGTVSDNAGFKQFLHQVSQRFPVIVDEAYLEYTGDFESRSAVSLVRDGANVLVFRTFDKIHGLAGLPIGYTLAPRSLADALRKQGVGDAESLGRLNISAASAALADSARVSHIREITSAERTKWVSVLDRLALAHTSSCANFIFFRTGLPQTELAAALRLRGIEIGRTFPPYTDWARITIGLPEENRAAQQQLREVLENFRK
jgi:histidinol-phosphate aminotransferase